MATESSEPRTGLILRMGGLALVTLLVVHGGLSAYYDRMAKAEELRKRGDAVPEALINLHADEKARLSSGAMPIEKAMEMLTEKGRIGAGSAITPSTSKDVAPLQGWSKMPGEVPAAMLTPPPAPPVAASVDGGAAPAATGPANKPDAGPAAPQKGPARPHK